MKATDIFFVLLYTGLCTATGPCRDGWVPFAENCYYFSHNLLSWPQAAETCEALHSTLATVLSAEEHTFLKTTLMKLHPSDAANRIYWIDGTDLEVEHVWRWASSGEILSYQDWAKGEPTNTGRENCLLLWGVQGFKMGDNPCGASWNYVCKSSISQGKEGKKWRNRKKGRTPARKAEKVNERTNLGLQTVKRKIIESPDIIRNKKPLFKLKIDKLR